MHTQSALNACYVDASHVQGLGANFVRQLAVAVLKGLMM